MLRQGISAQPKLRQVNHVMNEFEGRMQTILDAALDAAFNHVRHGGDHESRKLIAATLMEAVRSGTTALDELTSVGRRALIDLGNRSVG